MNLRRALLIAACLSPLPCSAAAQAPAAASSTTAGAAPRRASREPPCVQEFMRLRDEAAKKAAAIRTASARKAPAQEACGLFNAFSAAEAKMMKYRRRPIWCRAAFPASPHRNKSKRSTSKTVEIRTKVCQAAAAPPRPAGPSLSDALSAPITDSNNIKTGRGTFDTLTGTPLGSK